MIKTDGRPTIAWANPPEDDEHHDPRPTPYERGYDDARHGRSDFVRLTYKGDDRLDYMKGRGAYHADRILGRVA